jgi:hypothetical protein
MNRMLKGSVKQNTISLDRKADVGFKSILFLLKRSAISSTNSDAQSTRACVKNDVSLKGYRGPRVLKWL